MALHGEAKGKFICKSDAMKRRKMGIRCWRDYSSGKKLKITLCETEKLSNMQSYFLKWYDYRTNTNTYKDCENKDVLRLRII